LTSLTGISFSKIHSAFSTTYPIYLYEKKTEEVADVPEDSKETSEEVGEVTQEETKPERELDNDDEAVVEDVDEAAEAENVKPSPPLKKVTTESWIHLNDVPPLWQR
jgi:heat shock protein beta